MRRTRTSFLSLSGFPVGLSVWVICLGLVIPSTAGAYWKQPADVIQNTAYNLRSGEFAFGVFSPLQYGITDELTLSLHPVLELLLTPNVGFRYEIVEAPVGVNWTTNYLQTFLNQQAEGGFPGRFETGVIVSVPLHRRLIVSPFVGYGSTFATQNSRDVEEVVYREDGSLDFRLRKTVDEVYTEWLGQQVLYSLGINWLLSDGHMLMGQVRAESAIDGQSPPPPYGSVVWAIAWERLRVSVGAAVGRFPFQVSTEKWVTLPVYPILDLWLRI